MSNDLSTLCAVVSPPAQPLRVDWDIAEEAWGASFSNPFMELLDRFGVGSFQPGRLRLVRVDEKEGAELFTQRVESAQGSVHRLLESGQASLVPWGRFEDGDWLVSLKLEGGTICETIFVHDAYYSYEPVPGNATEILLALFNGSSPLYQSHLDNTLLCQSQGFIPAEPVLPASRYPILIVPNEAGNSVEIPGVLKLRIPRDWSVKGGACDCFLTIGAPGHIEGYLKKNPTTPDDPVTVRDAVASQNKVTNQEAVNSIRKEVEDWGVAVGADRSTLR